jgi:hypothetical protein
MLMIAACVLFLSIDLIQPVLAEDTEVPQLRSRIAELEARINHLEALLEKCMATGRAMDSDAYGWQNKKNWRSLEIGMDEKKVMDVLGEPVKIIEGVQTLWYYPNFYGGYVSFDESRRLSGWSEP